MDNNQLLLWLQIAALAVLVYMLFTYKSCNCGREHLCGDTNKFTYPGDSSLNTPEGRLDLEAGMF